MNNKELIGKIKSANTIYVALTPFIEKKFILDLVKQLDEPQKPVVPQFVDGYIKYAKEVGWNLLEAMKNVPYEDNAEFRKWFYEGSNVDVFARAWLDGYTVEKEKRYRVKVKGHIHENILVYGYGVKRYFFSSSLEGNRRAKHTRKELEQAGFGWVFDCPGMEVEEVEE